MGFKLPGKSIQTGTSAHSSALKMKKESMAKMYDSPADKALVGKQKNLPEDLKAKIEASPGKMASPAKETFSQAYRTNRNAGENTFTYKGRSYSTESASEKEARGGEGEYKNKRAKAKATTEVNTENMADAINAENTKTLEKNNKEKENVTVKVLTKDQLKDKQKEKVADKKDNLKDTKKQNKINTLEGKKDVADAKGKTKRSERLANRIERKKSRQDGDKSTNISRRDQRKAKTKNAQETINRENQDKNKESQKNTSSGNLKGSLANNEVKSTTKIKGSLS